MRRAVEQRGDPERERGLLHPARDRRRAVAAVLEREGQLGAHRVQDDLRLGVLQQRAGDRGEVGGAVLARVEAADDDPAAELAAVEVRDQPGRGPGDGRLAGGRQPRDDAELPGASAKPTSRSAGSGAPG
jgi:hypothetical protein